METRHLITYLIILFMVAFSLSFTEKSSKSNIKEENITYTIDKTVYKCFVAYDENMKGKRPAVLVVPEWWGMTDYPRMRARELAKLGYIAMAVDMFGEGKVAANPTEAQAFTAPYYSNPQLAKKNLDVAISKIKDFKQTDTKNIVAIGYCFGGSVVLNAAKLGADLKAVVSFHGGLKGVPADKNLLKAKILVCQGGIDKFVTKSDVTVFRHQMDSIGADYKLIVYPNATHAFTNPEATELGKKFNMPIEYNKKADTDSWNDMKMFFKVILK
ncbi:MAG: dienelactone hydrolase family protein [Paludibacter sp.]|nr:dienelactone hydrolase family protein [Paludibacter sp.]